MELGLSKNISLKGSSVNMEKFVRIGLPIILFLGSLLVVFLVSLPNWNKVQSMRSEIQAQEDLINQLNSKISRLEALSNQKNILDEDLGIVERAVPSDKEVPTLMTQINDIATETGVSLTALQFGGTLSGEEKKKPTSYNSVNLRVAAEGDFLGLQKFLETLEKASRIVDVDSLRFAKKTGEGGNLLSIETTVLAYFTSLPTFTASQSFNVDLSSKAFVDILDELKTFKVYNVVVPEEAVGKDNPFE